MVALSNQVGQGGKGVTLTVLAALARVFFWEFLKELAVALAKKLAHAKERIRSRRRQ